MRTYQNKFYSPTFAKNGFYNLSANVDTVLIDEYYFSENYVNDDDEKRHITTDITCLKIGKFYKNVSDWKINFGKVKFNNLKILHLPILSIEDYQYLPDTIEELCIKKIDYSYVEVYDTHCENIKSNLSDFLLPYSLKKLEIKYGVEKDGHLNLPPHLEEISISPYNVIKKYNKHLLPDDENTEKYFNRIIYRYINFPNSIKKIEGRDVKIDSDENYINYRDINLYSPNHYNDRELEHKMNTKIYIMEENGYIDDIDQLFRIGVRIRNRFTFDLRNA